MANLGDFDTRDEAIAAWENAYNAALEEALGEISSEATDAANEAVEDAIEEAIAEANAQVQEAWEEYWAAQEEAIAAWVEAASAAEKAAIDAAKAKAKEQGKPWYCMEDLPPIEYPPIDLPAPPDEGDYDVDVESIFADVYDSVYEGAAEAAADIVNSEIDLSEYLDCVDANDWGNYEFIYHYFLGNGEAVDVKDIGLEDEIRAADQYNNIMNNVTTQIGDAIAAQINATNPPTGTDQTIEYDFNNTYDFTNVVFSIGDTTISGEFTGTFVVEADGTVCWSGTLDVTLTDEFADPLDIFDVIPDGFELLGGDPYDITGSWTEEFGGCY